MSDENQGMEEESFAVKGSDAMMSLADLGDIDLNDSSIAEVRSVLFPQGVFDFEFNGEGGIKTVGKDDTARPLIWLDAKCVAVHSAPEVEKAEGDLNDIIDKTHEFGFYISEDLMEALGRMKAFVVDTGFTGELKLGQAAATLQGHRFTCRIKHKANKNDKDIINVRHSEVRPVGA